MALPTIPYNASTGNDTAPTGNDGSGTNGDISGSTLTLNETVDFTGVADDDSDYLWFEGNAGDRHLFQVTSFNPSVAACTSLTLGQTATAVRTGSNWAVNGTRQTFENDTSQRDPDDWIPGWRIEVAAGTYTMTGVFEPAADTAETAAGGAVTIIGTGTPNIVGNHAADVVLIDATRCVYIEGIKFSLGASATANSRFELASSAAILTMVGCILDSGGTATYGIFVNGSANINLVDCYFTGQNTAAVYLGIGETGTVLHCYGCVFDGSAGDHFATAAIYIQDGAYDAHIQECLIYDSGGDGIRYRMESGTNLHVVGCTIVDNVGDGLELEVLSDTRFTGSIANNIFAYNGGYGVNAGSPATFNYDNRMWIDFNAFYSNTSGALNNLTAGSNDVTFLVDPFEDRASDDYRINNTATGGAAARGTGFPNTFPDGT